MSKFLQRLHKEVLDKFPFSISGYNSPDKEYEDFFNKICKFQESLEDDKKIHFTISGFAKLQTTSNLSETELDKWKTESLKNLLFNDNYLGFSEPILSLYIALLQLLSPEKRVVNILAENVNNSILIKILLNENLDKIHFSFIKSDNTLLIEVPLYYFKSVKNGKKDSLQDLFKDIDYENDLIVKREDSSSSYSIVLKDEKTKKFNSVLKDLLDINTIVTIQKLPPENVYDKLLKEVLKNEKYNAKEIYSLIFASAILCYFYDCSLTYFVSTARVANNKRYTLGAMGIGLKAGNELSDNDKALYSILVNHLAANLSTQLIFESNKYLQREANRLTLKSALKSVKELQEKAEGDDENEKAQKRTLLVEILHGSKPVSEEFEKLLSGIVGSNPLLTPEFLSYYNSLKSKNENHISKYCLVTLTNFCKGCKIKDRCNVVLKVNNVDCCQSSHQVELINLPLLNSIVNKLKGESDAVECCFNEDEIVFIIKEKARPFEIGKLKNQLEGKENYGDFLNFLVEVFHPLDCHGILSIHGQMEDGSYAEIFNSRKTTPDVHNGKFVLNNEYNFPDMKEVKNIQIKFKNEL